MILILGGTTEGRKAAQVADEAGKPYFYSTVSHEQKIETVHAIRLTGGMEATEMEQFCRTHSISLLIDAAHPFAIQLHETVANVSARLSIPVVRIERKYPARSTDLIWCADYEEAMYRLRKDRIRNLLALTGVKTIEKLRCYWEEFPCWFRILDRDESISLARKSNFPVERLLFFQEGSDEMAILEKIRPDAMLTKESGDSGFFREKVEAARQFGIPVYVIQRPNLPQTFIYVYGTEGLRKAIERKVPDFFSLHSGFTTGTCATAAAKAALLALLTQKEQKESSITLPSGEEVTLPVAETTWNLEMGRCTVIKDAGDDPDVTNGCSIIAEVSLSPEKGIHFAAGPGVGIVTLPGLGLEIGGPAINATPRRLIKEELQAILQERSHTGININGLRVTLSIPGGKELAARTFNPKLGIIDGISIIGTSGIVRPFSNEAFLASIRKEVEVARAIGCETLVINSGAKSERYLKTFLEKNHPVSLPQQAFVHYGNFIGETLKIASDLHFKQVIMGIMLGKAVKLAEGALDTHSKKVVMNKKFLQTIALEAGYSEHLAEKIETITLARELWDLFTPDAGTSFFHLLLDKCYVRCAPLFRSGQLSVLLITENGEILYRL